MKSETQLAAFRMPKSLRKKARDYCAQNDITFSQLMRKAIRREIPEDTEEGKKEKVQPA